jgi:curved DNA-binding protein
MSKDLYKVLEVEATASASDIKSAYRRLVNIYHPDKYKSAGAEDKFKEIASAYETLGNETKRKDYDRVNTRSNPREDYDKWRRSNMYNDVDFDDIFREAGGFSGFHRWGEQENPKGPDVNIFCHLTLEEMFYGVEKEITLSTGKVKVNLPKGMSEGTKLKLQGKGDAPDRGTGPRGNAVIHIKELVHKIFKRDGDNLVYELHLGICDMLLGCQVLIPYIDGEVRVIVPPLMEDGNKLRLKGKGFKEGDMEVILKIYYPKTLSTNERRLLEELSNCANMKNLSVKSKNRN